MLSLSTIHSQLFAIARYRESLSRSPVFSASALSLSNGLLTVSVVWGLSYQIGTLNLKSQSVMSRFRISE